MISIQQKNVIEVDHYQTAKRKQFVSGDVFLSQRLKDEDRVVSVLADGLGSGVKASVLATLTATMALKYTASSKDVRTSAEIIMNTLPICSVRKISYSTFTVVDIDSTGRTRIIEHGNPPFIFFRDGAEVTVDKQEVLLKKWNDRIILFSEFDVRLGDRIVFFSDGVSQAGMGSPGTPLGWGDGVKPFIERSLGIEKDISAHMLARRIVRRAVQMDGRGALDDVTCSVIYFRKPRQMLLVTGPPFARDRDADLARLIDTFPGKRVISGGTTANIIARNLDREIETNMDFCAPGVPPGASMDGADLITEGTLTLNRVAGMLESGALPEDDPKDPASTLFSMMLDSDIVYCIVGTRINEAHQDPNIPVELDLRRNIIRRIIEQLEKQHCKETHVKFI
ncbi:MAG TPA: SpoIIE family protein phosphatase [Dissulfurispiraceae bacterium]|nr:SpoIIE family protein phosphatase [Dissulfurispiraceae bacterium]